MDRGSLVPTTPHPTHPTPRAPTVTDSYITGDLLPIIGAAVAPAIIMAVLVLITNRRR